MLFISGLFTSPTFLIPGIMAIVNSKEVLQSYIITTAKYDFSIYEKRILYRQIEIEQELLNGMKIRPGVKIETNLWKDKRYTIPVNWLLPNGEQDKNHYQVKKAFNSLMKKIINYEDEDRIVGFPLIMNFEVDKKGETVTWQAYSMVVDAIVNFAKGFRKYELKTAIEFNSVYSMRFYELLSGQERPITFTIDNLKAMFMLEDKYSLVAMFIKKVIDVAKKELDEKSPYSFEYKINKQGKKFHSITFYPTFKPEHRDEVLEARELQKQISLQWDLTRETVKYLKEVHLFDEKEIKQHIELFKEANNKFDLLIFLAEKRRYLETAKNPKGYIISCIKKAVKDFKEEKNVLTENTSEVSSVKEKTPTDLLGGLAKTLNVK